MSNDTLTIESVLLFISCLVVVGAIGTCLLFLVCYSCLCLDEEEIADAKPKPYARSRNKAFRERRPNIRALDRTNTQPVITLINERKHTRKRTSLA